jgi:glycine/D-amino acid oxidase-like deaminating enzyme
MKEPVWNGRSREYPTLPTLRGDTAAEACVIGLGGSGLATLGALLGHGLDVIGIDAHGVGGGAAGRNGGLLLAGLARFHHEAADRYGSERALACYHATEDALAVMADELPHVVRRVGSLRIAASPEELEDCKRQFDVMRRDGLAVERYSGPEGEGLLFPWDASMEPAEYCGVVAQVIQQAGARLFGETPAVAIEPGHVRTPSGSVRAGLVFVCVDGGLELLLPSLRGSVRSARLQMLATAPIAHRITDHVVARRNGYDYYRQLPSGEIVLGGGRDIGGEAEWVDGVAPQASETSEEVQAWLDSLLGEVAAQRADAGLAEAGAGVGGRAGAAQAPVVTHRWAGIAGYTESGLPVLRAMGDGIYAAGGYSGTGNLVGRLAGVALAELALHGRSAIAELFDGPD